MDNQVKKPEKTGEKHDTKFKKGQSGNPEGRPKGSFSLIEILKRELQKIPKDLPKDQRRSYAEALIKKMLDKGIIEGNEQTQKLIMNYVEGLPKQAIDITSGGKSISEILNETEK